MRSGYTLLESLVALMIAVVIIESVWASMHLITVGERSADRDAARALEEARALELLLRDLRSAAGPVTEEDSAVAGERSFKLQRWTPGADHRLKSIDVTWQVVAHNRIVRTAAGEPMQTFQFDRAFDDARRPFDLRVQKVDSAQWTGVTTPAAP